MQSLNGNSSNPSLEGFDAKLNPTLNEDKNRFIINDQNLDSQTNDDLDGLSSISNKSYIRNKSRRAYDFRVTDEKNAIKAHHYYYDPFILESFRQKIFKDFFKDSAGLYGQIKNHHSIKELKNERKQIFTHLQNLTTSLSETKCAKAFFILIQSNLEKGHALETLFPENCTVPEDLKILYNEILATGIPSELNSYMDFDSLDPKALLDKAMTNLTEKLGNEKEVDKILLEASRDINKLLNNYTQSLELNGLDGDNSNLNSFFVESINGVVGKCKGNFKRSATNSKALSYLESFTKSIDVLLKIEPKEYDLAIVADFIKKHWDIPLMVEKSSNLSQSVKRNSDLDKSIKDILIKVDSKNKKKSLDLILNSPSNQTDNNDLLGSVLDILTDKYMFVITQNKMKLNNLDRDLGAYTSNPNNGSIFKAHKETLLENTNLLEMLIKEYKMHSLARYDHLFNHYTAFVNVVNDLGDLGEAKHPGFKNRLKTIVSKLIENSSKNSNELTICPNLHRDKGIMGHEEIKRTNEENLLVKAKLNLLMGVDEKKKVIELDRAHTLPFPSIFAWNFDKVKHFIKVEVPHGDEIVFGEGAKNVLYNKDIFEQMRKRNVSHKEIEALFHEEFESLLKSEYSEKQLHFKGLELIRTFFLRLFSETELLPVSMNKVADRASEWQLKGDDYKSSLARSLKELVLMDGKIKESDTVEKLIPYLDKTVETVEAFMNDGKKINTPERALNLICLSLVKETLMMAVKGVGYKEAREKANQEIQNKVYSEFFNKIPTSARLKEASDNDITLIYNKIMNDSHDEIMQKMLL